MEYTLLPADMYEVVNKSLLTSADKLVLSMLYMPIVGSTAITLYNTLYDELKANNYISNELTHHHLVTNLGENIEDIKKARIKLEGIGLIRTYILEGSVNSYIYELLSPLTVNEFFNNPIFSTVLLTNVGVSEYNRLKSYFRVPKLNTKDYTEITSPFDVTFKSVNINDFTSSDDIIKKEKGILKYSNEYDFDALISSIPKGLMNTKALTKGVKELIINLSFLYRLSPLEMADLIKVSLNEKGLVDKELLRKNTLKFYEYNTDNRRRTLIYKSDKVSVINKENSRLNRIINVFETTKPLDFLKDKYKGVKPTSKDMQILEMLIIDLEFSPSVCNVLIDFILKTQNNRLVKSYVEVVAGEWKRANLTTAKEAMMYAESTYKKLKENKSSKAKIIKKEEKVPEWFNKDNKKEAINDQELEGFFKEF